MTPFRFRARVRRWVGGAKRALSRDRVLMRRYRALMDAGTPDEEAWLQALGEAHEALTPKPPPAPPPRTRGRKAR